jgi:hypothetical protein
MFDLLTGLPEITEEALSCQEGLREYVLDYITQDDSSDASNMVGGLDWLLGELDEVNWAELRVELEKC